MPLPGLLLGAGAAISVVLDYLSKGAQAAISLMQLVWAMLPGPLQVIIGIMLVSSLLWTFGTTLIALKGSGIHLADGAVSSLTLHVWGGNQSDAFQACSLYLNTTSYSEFESCANWNTSAMAHPPLFCNYTLFGYGVCWNFLPQNYDCSCDGSTIRYENGSLAVNCTGESGTAQSCSQIALSTCASKALIQFSDCYTDETESGSLYLLTLAPISSDWTPPPGNWFYVLTCFYLMVVALQVYSAGGLLR